LPISSEEARDATQLAIDPIGRNLIWLDSKNGRIELMNLKPNLWARRTLLSTQLQNSRALSIDTQSSKLYFSSIQTGSQIERSNLDGSQRESVLQLHGSGWITSLLIDSSQLFWTSEIGALMRVDLNGGADNIQMVTQHLKNPNSIAKSGKFLRN
jgi:sugar lactone lactonase YvrE